MGNFERNNQKPLDFNKYKDILKADDFLGHSEPVLDFIKSIECSVVNEDGETSKGKTR